MGRPWRGGPRVIPRVVVGRCWQSSTGSSETGFGGVGVHGGVKIYRGSAAAARAYVEADHSRADDYYLGEGSGVATRYVAEVSDSVSPTVRRKSELDGESYERWVAG